MLKGVKMMREKWPLEHKRLFYTDLSDEEIAEKTGRTITAVHRQRYHTTGHWSKDNPRPTMPERISKVEGECRILDLCKKLNIKLMEGEKV